MIYHNAQSQLRLSLYGVIPFKFLELLTNINNYLTLFEAQATSKERIMDFWLINLVYPIIASIIGLIIGALIITPILGRAYGFSTKESFKALLNK